MSPIVCPETGSEDQSLRISAWLVEPGDEIMTGDRIVELAIKGVTTDIISNTTGKLDRVELPVGTEVETGSILGWITEPGD